jgi:hypothetical protein
MPNTSLSSGASNLEKMLRVQENRKQKKRIEQEMQAQKLELKKLNILQKKMEKAPKFYITRSMLQRIDNIACHTLEKLILYAPYDLFHVIIYNPPATNKTFNMFIKRKNHKTYELYLGEIDVTETSATTNPCVPVCLFDIVGSTIHRKILPPIKLINEQVYRKAIERSTENLILFFMSLQLNPTIKTSNATNNRHSEKLDNVNHRGGIHTIVKITPFKDQSYDQNGEPMQREPHRLHDVRGHQRRYKSGKVVFVRAHQRGDERIGVVTKTYKIQ